MVYHRIELLKLSEILIAHFTRLQSQCKMGQRSVRKHAEEQAQPALGPPKKYPYHLVRIFFFLSRRRIELLKLSEILIAHFARL